MKLQGDVLVEQATAELEISLADLIALASIWVSPEVYRVLEGAGGVWYRDRRRANLGLRVNAKPVEAVGQVIDGVTLDSNTYANVAFKRALGIHRHDFVGFHVCHIWPGTAYDVTCYTNIANLVGIPAELSSLTDHHPHIVACLKYRAWELYRWKPSKELTPVKPEGYPKKWRDPVEALEPALRAAARVGRVRSRAPISAMDHGGELEEPLSTPRVHLSDLDRTDAAITVAFYLSKFDHERLGIGNQGETFDRVASLLGVKRNTLKGYRDYFDSHTGSHREGWKVPLPPQLAAVFPSLMRFEELALREKVFQLLRPPASGARPISSD